MNNQKATPSAGANAGGHREVGSDGKFSFDSTMYEPVDSPTIPQQQNKVSVEVQGNAQLEAALAYAANGYRIFPCREVTTENGAAKAPYISDWPHRASSDESQIRAWWATWPNAAIGLIPPVGSLVLDIDCKPGEVSGYETLAALEDEHGPLPETFTVITPSGGKHLYFIIPDGLPVSTTNRKKLGFDVRVGEEHPKGYVIAAPSKIEGYGEYKIAHNIRPANSPQWLVDELRTIATGRGETSNVGDIDIYDRKLRQEDYEYLEQLRNDPVWNGTTDQEGLRHPDGRWNSTGEFFVIKAVRRVVGRDHGQLIFRLTCESPLIQSKFASHGEYKMLKRLAKHSTKNACTHVSEEEADAQYGKDLGGSLLKGIIQERVSGDEPVPLSEVKRGDPPFPVDALSPVLRDAAKEIHRTQGADLAICCQSLLLASALAVQPHYDVEITGIGKRPCSLFGVTLGKSSARKSTVDKYALAEHDRHEEELVLARESSMKQYEVDEMIYKKRKENVGKRIAKLTESLNPSDRENIMVEQSRLGPPPNKPYEVVLTGTDPTVEGVTRVFREGVVNFGIFADEGSKLFGGYGMNKDNATKTAGAFSNLWDGQPVDVIRGGSEIQKFFGRRVSMHLMVQPKVFQTTLSNDEVRDQGFLNRFLYVAPKPKIKKSYVAESLEENRALQEYYRMIKRLLVHPVQVADIEASPTGRRLIPRLITAGEGVVARFAKYHDDNEARADVAGDEEHYYSYFAKLPEQAMRIAGVLSAIEGHQKITLDVMERSIQIADYYWSQALLVFDKAELDGQHEDALAMHKWIMRRGDENHRVGRRWLVSRVTPKRLQGNKSATPVLDDLLRLGWVENEGPGECTYEQGGKIKAENFEEVIRAVEIPE